MSAAERCLLWPERDRCCFAGMRGVTCTTCGRFESYDQARAALARQRRVMLSGAEATEEAHRRRILPGLLRSIGAVLDRQALALALDDAHGYAMGRCQDVLRMQLADAVLEHGAHALELEVAWLAEWRDRWARQNGIEVAHG